MPALRKSDIEVCIDGNFAIPLQQEYTQVSVVKGDSLIASVAAASIVAKVTRDRYMTSLNRFFPDFRFNQHKGYGTPQHYQEIQQFGLTDYHRRSFLQGIAI
jgi:ribonuclease HII